MALTALRDLSVEQVDVVALAKMRVMASPQRAEIERSEERVFVPGRSNPIVLRRNSNALFLLQRLRDEAHRFAVTYHKKLRTRESLRSGLDEIDGIGPARKRALLRHFGSLKRLREASPEDIRAVESISAGMAERIYEALRTEAVTGDP